jgi:hypothetical protein
MLHEGTAPTLIGAVPFLIGVGNLPRINSKRKKRDEDSVFLIPFMTFIRKQKDPDPCHDPSIGGY